MEIGSDFLKWFCGSEFFDKRKKLVVIFSMPQKGRTPGIEIEQDRKKQLSGPIRASTPYYVKIV